MLDLLSLEKGRGGFTKSQVIREGRCGPVLYQPVCGKWVHLVKPEGARTETQPAPSALRTFFFCLFYFILEVISSVLNNFYFISLLFHPPQMSQLML